MSLDVTRQHFSLSLLQYVVLFGLFALRFYLAPLQGEGFGDGGTLTAALDTSLPGDWIRASLAGSAGWIIAVTAGVLLINSFSIVKTITRNMVFPFKTYLPGIIYLTVSCGIFFSGADPAALICALLLTNALALYVASFVRSYSFDKVFRASGLIGMAILVYPPAIVCAVLVPVAMVVFRRSGRESIAAVAGLILPTLFWGYLMWIAGGEFSSAFIGIYEGIVTSPMTLWSEGEYAALRIGAAALIALLTLLGLAALISMSGKIRTRAHKVNVFMIWMMAAAGAMLALPSGTAGDMAVAAIPVSFIASAYFVKYRGWLPTLLYAAMLVAVISLNILPLF